MQNQDNTPSDIEIDILKGNRAKAIVSAWHKFIEVQCNKDMRQILEFDSTIESQERTEL